MKAGQIVYCRACNVGWSVTGMLPATCPDCGRSPAQWTRTSPNYEWRDPGRQLEAGHVTQADRDFLRTNRIDPEAA